MGSDLCFSGLNLLNYTGEKMPFVAATAWNISESSICKASWERVGCNRSRNCGRKNPRTLKAAPCLFIP